MAWHERPREALKLGAPPPATARVRDAVALTRREAACLGVGLAAAALSWAATLTWL